MKKMLCAIFAMIFLFGSNNMAMAVEDDEGVLVEPIADINVVSAKIKSEENGEFTFSCNVINNLSAEGNLLMRVQIIKTGENNARTMVDSFVSGEVFSAPNGKIEKVIKYKAPNYLRGDFDVLLSIVNESGAIYSMVRAGEITLNGSEQFIFLDSSKCYLAVDGDKEQKKYPLSMGVDVEKNEILRGKCFVQSNFSSNVNARVKIAQHWRSDFGKKIGEESGDNIMFVAGEGKEISVVIPTVKEPQAYNAVMTLVDEKGKQISNEVSFHYVMRGVSATIQKAQHDINGDGMSVSFEWTPSADSHFQTRSGQIPENSYSAVVMITDQKGVVCAQSEPRDLSSQDVKKETIALTIPEKCRDQKISLKILDMSGSVLDERVLSKDALINANNINADGAAQQNVNMKSFFVDLFKVIGIFGAFALIGGLGWRFWRRKNIMSVLLIMGFCFMTSSVNAVKFEHVIPAIPEHPAPIILTVDANLDKEVYQQGDTMILTVILQDSRCTDSVFVPSRVSLKVFGNTSSSDTDTDNDGYADLADGMQGLPLFLSAKIPENQVPGTYDAKVCGKLYWGGFGSSCVNISFKVAGEDGVCSLNATGEYKWSETEFRGNICATGTPTIDQSVSFPQYGQSVVWGCNGTAVGMTSTAADACQATHLKPEAKCGNDDMRTGQAYFATKPALTGICFEDCNATLASPSVYDEYGQWLWNCTHISDQATPKTIPCSAKSCLSTQPFSLQRYVYFDAEGNLGDAKIDGITCAGVCCKIDERDLNGNDPGTSLCTGQSGFVDIDPGRNEFTAQCWYDEGIPGINDGEQTVPFTPLVVNSMCASHTCSAQGTCQAIPKEAINSNACTNSCTSDADCSSGKLIEDRP